MYTSKMLLNHLLLLSSALSLAKAVDETTDPFIATTTTTDGPSSITLSDIPTFSAVPDFFNTSSVPSNTSTTDPTPTLSMSLPVGITSFPTGNIDPTAIPTPQPPTEKNAAYLVRHMHDRILRDYELYSTAFCFHRGSTVDCRGPWLYGNTWNNASLSHHLVKNTLADPHWVCSSDQTYLGARGSERNFYGFGADNVTESLSETAHFTSMFAAGSCLMNSTCASLYNNDTDQMYADYRFYINSTMLSYLSTELSKTNGTQSYCPASIQSTAGMFSWLTDHFDGGREYFGFHNAMFLPGVMERLDPEEQIERIGASIFWANNARKVEGVFLNMVFFTYDRNAGRLRRRSQDDDMVEIYPGCTRREFIAKGKCDGVVPPRTHDMDGSVVSMADRDKEETFQTLSHPLGNTGLVRRDATCSKIASLERQLKGIETGIALYNAVSIGIAAWNVAESVILADALLIEGAPLIAALGIVYFGGALALDICSSFQACNGVPDVPAALVKSLTSVIAGGKLGPEATKTGEVIIDGVKGIKLGKRGFRPFPLAKAMKPFAKFSGAFGTTATLALMVGAQSYYSKAEKCCEVNCGGAVCQQTSLGCVLHFSSKNPLDCSAN